MTDRDAGRHARERHGQLRRASALRDVTAAFPAGAVGLLGPNGAGKSTMIKALLGFIAPDGRPHARARARRRRRAARHPRPRRLHAGERRAHSRDERRRRSSRTAASWPGLPRVDAMQRAHEVLFYVGLGEARYRNVETYSTGMKQRIKLAQALVHDPDLLFLDEPTNGMDPEGPRRDARARARSRPQQRRQPDPVVAPAARTSNTPATTSSCMDKGRVAVHGPIAVAEAAARQVFELRVKTAERDLESFIARLAPPASSATPTDEDVMRVFVPGDAGARELSRWRPPSTRRSAIFGRACRRSRTCSRTPWWEQ